MCRRFLKYLGMILLVYGFGAGLAAAAPKPSIVLVHGLWADGSCYNEIIPTLQAAGYNVIAVQNPFSSLADDVAAVKRALDRAGGPVWLAIPGAVSSSPPPASTIASRRSSISPPSPPTRAKIPQISPPNMLRQRLTLIWRSSTGRSG